MHFFHLKMLSINVYEKKVLINMTQQIQPLFLSCFNSLSQGTYFPLLGFWKAKDSQCMWVHAVGPNGLHAFYAFYAHPAANQNQSMRVSVSVSAGGGREGSLVCWGPEFDQTWRFSSFSSFRMLRLVLFSTVFLCLIVPAPAPFAKSDPRSIFNFLIEPWWCLVPKIVRCQIMRIRRWMGILVISQHQ